MIRLAETTLKKTLRVTLRGREDGDKRTPGMREQEKRMVIREWGQKNGNKRTGTKERDERTMTRGLDHENKRTRGQEDERTRRQEDGGEKTGNEKTRTTGRG